MIKTLRMLLWMVLLTGVVYPMLIIAVARIAVFKKARGSLIIQQGEIIGSSLIGQHFTSPRYFWSRPSATQYSAMPATGSQLGPTSAVLKAQVEQRRKALHVEGQEIPSELLYASGSGIDPHITQMGAYFQIARVAQARGISPERLKALIDQHTVSPLIGFLGIRHVNVLNLNIALDKEQP